ncbi:MAG TPA: copper resistance protein CopC [Streptosporangiaceae bacterium]|nr:copper resistance protein CopC [Streptosporangiaceae bacterium]
MRPGPARGWPARLAGALLAAAALQLLAPAAAAAHAVPVSASPAPGARLGSAPAVVVIVFDEPLVARLSGTTVTDPAGRQFRGTVSGKTIRVPLTGTATGIYQVDWKTVSVIDGHTISGSYQFGVGVSPAMAAEPAGTTAQGPAAPDVIVAILRGIEYALLLLACGLALLGILRRDLPLRLLVILAADALLVSGVAVVAAESLLASSGFSAAGIIDYLTNGVTGWARVARLALEAAVAEVAIVRGRMSPVLLAGIVVAVAVAGHGADVEPAWQGIAVNAGHLAAAGVWAGGIMALALLRVTGRWQAAGREVLARFSTVAPWAFAVSVLLGAVQAIQLLGSPGQVLSTPYGLTLVAKAVAVAAMVPLSVLAWRRIRVSVRAEAALAVVVVAAAAALAAYPVVPKEAREAAQPAVPASAAGPASPLPLPGDLTMGGRAGQVMVGLSVHPGRPGSNTVRAYLASPATAASPARIQVQGQWHALSSCGASCRSARVDLRGGERVAVAVGGRGGGTAVFDLPSLPAGDGTVLARSAAARMNSLRSYRVAEDLSGIRSAYSYARPHRMWLRTWYGDGVQQTLWLGRSVYVVTKPGTPWRLRSRGTLAPVPYFPWDPFVPFGDARILGTGSVAGTPVTMVSVFAGHGSDPDAVWFTLYVDQKTGLVLRSQMWATNHFMNDRFSGFNQPGGIPRRPG